MNDHVKKLWIAALTGGEYAQGYEFLKQKNNSFCCLGVLCDLHARETGASWTPAVLSGCESYLDSAFDLPKPVIEWAGLQVKNPVIRSVSLTQHNDHDQRTFAEIAQLIDQHL